MVVPPGGTTTGRAVGEPAMTAVTELTDPAFHADQPARQDDAG